MRNSLPEQENISSTQISIIFSILRRLLVVALGGLVYFLARLVQDNLSEIFPDFRVPLLAILILFVLIGSAIAALNPSLIPDSILNRLTGAFSGVIAFTAGFFLWSFIQQASAGSFPGLSTSLLAVLLPILAGVAAWIGPQIWELLSLSRRSRARLFTRIFSFIVPIFLIIPIALFFFQEVISRWISSLYETSGDRKLSHNEGRSDASRMRLLNIAENEYISASNFSPKNVGIRRKLGQVYEELQSFDKAVENYRLVEASKKGEKPNNTSSIEVAIARTYLRQRNFVEADNWLWTVAHYRNQSESQRSELFRNNPDAYYALRNLVNYYLSKENPSYNDAGRWLELGLKVTQNDSVRQAELHVDLSTFFFGQQNYSKAKEYLEKAITVLGARKVLHEDPYGYSVFKSLVAYYLSKSDFETARRWLNQALPVIQGDTVKQDELGELQKTIPAVI